MISRSCPTTRTPGICLDSCELHALEGSCFSVAEIKRVSLPVSGYTAGAPGERRALVCRIYCGPAKDIRLETLRIPEVRECPGVSYESNSAVGACIVTDSGAPVTMVSGTDKGARFEGMCLWGINYMETFL